MSSSNSGLFQDLSQHSRTRLDGIPENFMAKYGLILAEDMDLAVLPIGPVRSTPGSSAKERGTAYEDWERHNGRGTTENEVDIRELAGLDVGSASRRAGE